MVYILLPVVVIALSLLAAWRTIVWMPGTVFRGIPSPLEEQELLVRQCLEQDLTQLAEAIGPRNVSHNYRQLIESAEFIERTLEQVGYDVRRQEFRVDDKPVWNIDVERTGSSHPGEIVVVGAHYDTIPGSPGANDNGSAVVSNLALARAFAEQTPERTVRFAFFVNEEMPYYMTDSMGSLRYARQCQTDSENIIGMLSLETIGCYLQEPATQRYPVALLGFLYPTTGNFVALVGNIPSRRLVRRLVQGMRRTQFRYEGMAAPGWLKDIFRSDHAAFWHCGYPALMVTDTANFRYEHYHTAEDTVDKINFTALARVVTGLEKGLHSILNR